MEFDRLLSAAADYGFPMLVSSYLLVRMEGRIEKLSANIESLTHVLQEIVAAFQSSPLPVPVIIACVSFIIGVLTGMSQGHVAIVMPIVAAMQTGSLNLAGVAMAFGIAGQMLTPTHMCLVITVDYFKANFFKTLKPVLLCEIIILTLFTAYTYFTW